MKHAFKLAVTAAAVVLAMNPALAEDRTYDADVVVIGAGASGSAAAWAAAEKRPQGCDARKVRNGGRYGQIL